MKLYTIGFTKKTARQFFALLKKANITTLLDTRLNNVSQLAAYTKKDDLEFFVNEILHANYLHAIELAPTKDILDAYKNKEMSWQEYEIAYNALLKQRNIKDLFPKIIDIKTQTICLLCSEAEPSNCHRRLLAEYLKDNLKEKIKIVHL